VGEQRVSGFPRLRALGREVFVAWTDTSQEATRVRSARLAF